MGKSTRRQKLGKIAHDLLSQPHHGWCNPMEIAEANEQKHRKKILDTLEDGIKIYKGDFFIVSILTKRPYLQVVYENRVFHRHHCPTPTYDQTTFHYIKADNDLRHIWTIPDQQTSMTLRDFALDVVPEEQALRDFVIDFYDGTLDKLCNELNKNKPDIILYKKSEVTDDRQHSIS